MSVAIPFECHKSPFNLLFAPFDTTMWTFFMGNGQTTRWERFSWTPDGTLGRLFRHYVGASGDSIRGLVSFKTEGTEGSRFGSNWLDFI